MALTNLMYKGHHFDSDEEVFFAMWASELWDAEIITKWIPHPGEIEITSGLKVPYIKKTKLKTKVKIEEKDFTVLRPHVYSMDFILKQDLRSKGIHKLFECLIFPYEDRDRFNKDAPLFYSGASYNVYIEIKPSFDQNNMERLFKINQKVLWEYDKIFVNLVEPMELFRKTFLPSAAEQYFRYKVVPKKAQAKGKVKGDFKFDWTPKTLKQFLND